MKNLEITNQIGILISCNRNDFFLTRLLVASIRKYLKNTPIYLLKDDAVKKFDTSQIEDKWNVKIFDHNSIRSFGWGGSKIFAVCNSSLPGKYWLKLDSDIVFLGNVLAVLPSENWEFIVHPEFVSKEDFNHNWIRTNYFNPNEIITKYSNYKHPGFFFNSGQFFFKSGVLLKSDFKDLFDFTNFKFLNLCDFPSPDQSLLNFVLGTKNFKIKPIDFMIWSSDKTFELKVQDLGKLQKLIHYAGDIRHPLLSKMKHSKLLKYYQSYYYSKFRFPNISRLKDIIFDLLFFI